MSTAYWQQFSRSEIDEMHGFLAVCHKEEDEQIDPEAQYNYLACDCGNCMKCLGLSWSDFL